MLANSIDIFKDGSYAVQPAGEGKLVYVKRRDQLYELATQDAYYSRYAPNGSFSQVGGMGIDDFILLGANEMKFIFSVLPNNLMWQWAVSTGDGTIYTHYDSVAGTARWPIILISSTYTNLQYVRLLSSGNIKIGGILRPAWRVDGIPYQANGDYSAYGPDRHPEFWMYAWTDFVNGTYGPSKILPDGTPLTFRMPLFDPLTFPVVSTTCKTFGALWIDANCFGGNV